MATPDRQPSRLQRDRSQERGRRQTTKTIFEEIESAMKLPNDSGAYISRPDLKQIWSDLPRIKTVLQPGLFSPKELQFIQRNLIMILSTLIWIDANECITHFRTRFFDPVSNIALFTDAGIPFEKNMLSFLDPNYESALRQQFYDNQFRFKPVIITITSNQTPQKIENPKERLPFESRQVGVGAGGYGKVDCVGISSRHIIMANGADFGHVYKVACKQITLPEDFDKEKENLQILKQSLTSHDRIMLHFTTIEHGPNRYILLPYAAWGDLEVFFFRGMRPYDRKPQYDFKSRFPKVQDNNDIAPELLTQCWSLAEALAWLHNGITIENSSSTVLCAHMDLKPANILIQKDDTSIVGKWMISDFGISVLRDDSEYGSIQDYISQITMNTRPKRIEGTYQAPEVKISESALGQASHLTRDQRGIGRKSDIWSFGCILSEVLTFSLGRDESVKEFSNARKVGQEDNYFYSEKVGQSYLRASQTPKEYEVRPSVLSWLDGLCNRAKSPQNWVECFSGTIRKILVVDTEQRPDATRLSKLIRHVRNHVEKSRGSEIVSCSILNPEIEEIASSSPPLPGGSFRATNSSPPPSSPPRIPRKPISGRPQGEVPTPRVLRTTTFEQEVIHDEEESSILPALEEVASSVTSGDENTLSRPDPQPVQTSENSEFERRARISSGASSSLLLPFANYQKPSHAHGIMIDPAALMKPSTSTRVDLPKPQGTKLYITAMALSNFSNGARIACLSKSSVYLYALDSEGLSVVPETEIKLTVHDGWKSLSLAGNFLVVWGFSSVKWLHFCDIREPQHPRIFSAQEKEMVQGATVSMQGVAALVCGSKLIIATLNSQEDCIPLLASYDQIFTDAAFNETGDILFAWAYGQKDTLYVWRFQGGILNQQTETESHYETILEKKGKPYLTRVLPYNSYQGCIILKPDKRLFPAQIHSSLKDKRTTMPRNNEINLFNLQASCVFNDHSMITVEKETLHHARLKEYQISYGSTHLLRMPGIDICKKLKSNTDNSSQVLVVKQGENIITIICNKNATVEFVKIEPQ